jgi:hypothetical protein
MRPGRRRMRMARRWFRGRRAEACPLLARASVSTQAVTALPPLLPPHGTDGRVPAPAGTLPAAATAMEGRGRVAGSHESLAAIVATESESP